MNGVGNLLIDVDLSFLGFWYISGPNAEYSQLESDNVFGERGDWILVDSVDSVKAKTRSR